MLGRETLEHPGRAGPDANLVVQEFRDRVLPCGVEALNRFEAAVEAKLTLVRSLADVPPDRLGDVFRETVDGVVSTRPFRAEIVNRSRPDVVRSIVVGAREGRLGASSLPDTANRLEGAPEEVRIDLASELLHAGAPDRIGLLARWVWNPARGTGIVAAYGGPGPKSYADLQARLGELRLELGAVGFPSPTFAAVDVLLALSYAGRLGEAVDRSFQGGGIERLLPGSFPLATMLLGVRRRLLDADR